MAEHGSFVYWFEGQCFVAGQDSVEPLEQLLQDDPVAMVRLRLVSGGALMKEASFQGFEAPRMPSPDGAAEQYIPDGYEVVKLHRAEYEPPVDLYGPYTLLRVELRPSMIIVPTPL